MRHLGAFALFLTVGVGGLSALGSARVEAATPSPWRQVGTNPFSGSPEVACDLHAASKTMTKQNCLAATALQKTGECTTRQLRDGEVLFVTFTRNGVHGIELKQVAFGDAVPLDDSRRTADSCRLPDGKELIRPHECNNWSAAPAPVQKKVRYQTAPQSYNAPLLEHVPVPFPMFIYDRGKCIPLEVWVDASGPAYHYRVADGYVPPAGFSNIQTPYGVPSSNDY